MNKFAKLFLVISIVSAVGSVIAADPVPAKTDYKAKAYSCFKTIMTSPFERMEVTKKDDKGNPVKTNATAEEIQAGTKSEFEKEELSGAKLWVLGCGSRAIIAAGIVAAAVAIKKCKCTADKATEATN